VDEGHVVHMLRHVRQHRRNHLPALTRWCEGPRRLHQVAVLTLKRDFDIRARHWRAVKFLQHRFVIPQVHVRRRSRAEDLQHLLRLRRKVWLVLRHSGEFVREQTRKRDTSEPGGHLAEEMAAREV
jgi:hypothetical protein